MVLDNQKSENGQKYWDGGSKTISYTETKNILLLPLTKERSHIILALWMQAVILHINTFNG